MTLHPNDDDGKTFDEQNPPPLSDEEIIGSYANGFIDFSRFDAKEKREESKPSVGWLNKTPDHELWSWRPQSLTDSPVMDVASRNAHRLLNHLVRELQRPDGLRNGEIEAGPRAVEKSTGLHHRNYWAAVYELLALGLIEHRRGRFGVTWMRRYDGKEPSCPWTRFKTRRQATIVVELAIEVSKKDPAHDTTRLAALIDKLPRPMTATERSRKRRARLAAERDSHETASDATRAPLCEVATETAGCNARPSMQTGHRCNARSSMRTGHASMRGASDIKPSGGNADRSAPPRGRKGEPGAPIPIIERDKTRPDGDKAQLVTITPERVVITIDGVPFAQWKPSPRDRKH